MSLTLPASAGFDALEERLRQFEVSIGTRAESEATTGPVGAQRRTSKPLQARQGVASSRGITLPSVPWDLLVIGTAWIALVGTVASIALR